MQYLRNILTFNNLAIRGGVFVKYTHTNRMP